MKTRNILLLVLFTSISAFAQEYDHTASAKVTGGSFKNPDRYKEKPQGSPYVQNTFAKAKIININVEAYMRYNVFKDEFEFITPKNDTLVLDKVEDFSNILFSGLKKKYALTSYTNDEKLVYGYLLELYEKNGYTLYKKENIGLTEAKIAKTSLERDMPAKYSKKGDTFFLKNKEAGTKEFPDSKKALIKLFPEKKATIETYLKENKIDFEAEADLIKIINLLTQ